jgi:replicative DNA helicase
MQTLNPYQRSALEGEVLGRICQRPDLLSSHPLTVDDFADGRNKKIFQYIEAGGTVSLSDMAQKFKLDDIKHLFETDYIPTLYDFTSAYKLLHEDNMRQALITATAQCGDSMELFNYIESFRSANKVVGYESFSEHVAKYAQEQQKIKDRQEKGLGIGLIIGWNKFNRLVPLCPSEYAVLGARTSIGKSAFSLNIAVEAAMLGQRVAFISLEMPRKPVFDRVKSILDKEPIYKSKYAKNSIHNYTETLNQLGDNFDFFYFPSCTTGHVRQVMNSRKYDLIVVDYLQLLKDGSSGRSDTENLRLGRISGALKQMAGEFKCVVLAAAQLNRESEKQSREPRLSDLRDSGTIEQDADVVMLLHRDNRDSVEAKLIIAKNRTGAVGSVDFVFNPEWAYFMESKAQMQ